MSSSIDKIKAIFIAALGKASLEARAAYLDEACADDPKLRRNVDELLQVHDSVHSDENPEPIEGTMDLKGTANLSAADPESVGDFLPSGDIDGRYRIIEVLGEGGMGLVCLAQQLEPVRRKVALKVIKLGMDTRRVLMRFEAERQALAVLDHQNIAKVFDGGITSDGRPYFVMEYVKGVALTAYCDSNRLTIRERLELFLQVCQAVHHAHQKGIIHRDLKPSNILVALFDEKAVVKVIDFGLAKALHQPLTEFSQFTPHGTAVGTAMYMSPEQAIFNNLDIDTRTDIYSLGVILYELLTGTTPLEKQRYKQAAWEEVLRIIRDEEPMRPSTKISSVVELPSIAAQRRVEPLKLNRLLRGELDWIVMKALEKERNRRYDTASSMGLDVQRYLNEEPVSASPPSALYRLRKIARKHKVAVATAGLLLLSLIAGVIGTTSGMFRARRAEGQAQVKHEEAVRLRGVAETALAGEHQARLVADARARDIESALDFVDGILLAQAEPSVSIAPPSMAFKDLTLRNLLDRADREVSTRFRESPQQEARVRRTLGQAFRALGARDDLGHAESHLKEAVRLRKQLTPDDQEKIWEDEIELGRTLLLVDPPRADAHFQRMLADANQKRPETDPLRLRIQMHAGAAKQFAGKPDVAIERLQPVLKLQEESLGPTHPDTIKTRSAIAWVQLNRMQFPEALAKFLEVLEQQRASLPANDVSIATTLNNLGLLHRLMSVQEPDATRRNELLDQAAHYYQQSLKLIEHANGTEHHFYFVTKANLGAVSFSRDQFAEAVQIYEEVLPKIEKILVPHDRTMLGAKGSYAAALLELGDTERAEELVREVYEIVKSTHPPDHPDVAKARNNVYRFLMRAKRFDEAKAFEPPPPDPQNESP